MAMAQQVTKCSINMGGAGSGTTMEPRCITRDLDSKSGISVRACPQAKIDVGYTDNVFRESSDAVGDGFVQLSPSLEVDYLGLRHDLGMNFGLSTRRQFRRSSNNFIDLRGSANGTWRISRNTSVNTIASFRRGQESRESLEAAGTRRELASFVRASGGAGVTYAHADGFVSLGQTISHRRFLSDSTEFATTRDNITYKTSGCVGRTLARRLGIVLIGRGTYVDRLSNNGVTSANDNYTVSALASFVYRYTGITQLEMGMGWLRTATLGMETQDKNAFVLRGAMKWRVTDLTTINTGIATRASQTGVGGSGVLLQRRQHIGVSHDLLPRVRLTASTHLSTQDVQGADANARTWSGGLSAGYQLHSRAQIMGRYRHTRRLGRGGQASFVTNSFVISFVAAY